MTTAAFDTFVRTRSPHLLRLAYLLTRDHGHAEDLVQTALARAYPAWRRIDGDPEPYVRTVLVHSFASWRGRRWHGERPSAVLPEPPGREPQAEVDARDEVWRALVRLPPRQRAVVVLRYFEDLSEAQIADALGISSGSVKGYASKGLAALRADESLSRLDVPEAPDAPDRLDAVRNRVRATRRRRAIAGAAAATVFLVVAFLVGPHIRRHSTPEPVHVPVQLIDGRDLFGYHIFGQVDARIERLPMRATWVPGPTDEVVIADCTPDRGIGLLTVEVDGHVIDQAPCGGPTDHPRILHFVPHLPAGEPAAMTLRIEEMKGTGPVPRHGTIHVEVAHKVPFAEYKIPPAVPAEPLPARTDVPPGRTITPGGGPIHVVCGGKYFVMFAAQSPGIIALTVNGRALYTYTFWDWNAEEVAEIDVPAGPDCEIAAVPSHLTGDWEVVFTGPR